ncbi:MAG: COR domain-containing protein, partial [Rhodoferax sp.]
MTPEQQQAYDTALERIETCRLKRSSTLDLNDLGLTCLPPQIFSLTALTGLFIARNKLSSLPKEISQLTKLTHLALWENQLSSLPPEIGQLTALTTLYLSRNKLHSLPLQLFHLSELTVLGLWGNQLSTLPPEIGQLTALTALHLSLNQLGSLPPEIGQLTALTVLHLSSNQLSTLPPVIGQLTALTELHLWSNQLSSVPLEISQLTALTELFLHYNPALSIPDSVLGPSYSEVHADEKKTAARPQDILNWYFTQREGAAQGTLRAVNEVKVMLVGRGGAGKTSLRRFFMGQEHAPKEPETPGIALDSFPLPCVKGNMTVRLWDFAGQEITHALHQFFLTEGCIYVLVLDPRSNTEMQDAEYWLGLLQRYAGGAPVLLALNRQDACQGGYDVDRRMLQERFPFIKGFTPTNCEKREGCDELLQRLRIAIEALKDTEPPHLMVPQGWLQVMADCESQAPGRQHLTLDQFRSICVQRGESTPAMQESLARLLHKLGTVLHFVDEPRLRDTTVLSPHWVTDGVYRLLRCNERPGSDGMLTLAEAMQALPGETEKTARFFLRLMERFEMCFPLDEEEDGKPPSYWLIPGALGEFQPEGVTAVWQQPGSVRMRYVYDPLPEGVLPRFIVRTHLLSEGQPRWRHGVVLQDGQAKALVRRGSKRNHVDITAFGPEAERLRLLEIIQGNFERIHADLPNPKPVAELELTGLPNIFHPVAVLEASERGK